MHNWNVAGGWLFELIFCYTGLETPQSLYEICEKVLKSEVSNANGGAVVRFSSDNSTPEICEMPSVVALTGKTAHEYYFRSDDRKNWYE